MDDGNDFEGRGRGRPATGSGVRTNARLAPALVARIKAYADAEFMSFADALRELIERGLNGGK